MREELLIHYEQRASHHRTIETWWFRLIDYEELTITFRIDQKIFYQKFKFERKGIHVQQERFQAVNQEEVTPYRMPVYNEKLTRNFTLRK